MAGVSFLICLCVFNEASHAEADGGAILDSAGSAAQSIHCSTIMGSLNFPFCGFMNIFLFLEMVVKNRLPFNTILQTLY